MIEEMSALLNHPWQSFQLILSEFNPDDFQGLAAWRGLRPCSPDGLPYIGRTRSAANLLVGTGHAMMGVSLAPITGKILAQAIGGEPTDVDLTLLSPDRYQ